MNVEQKVKGILCELSGEQEMENAATLQGDLALDSLSMVMMLIQIEDVFGIELHDADMNPLDFNTVQNVIDMVAKYCGGDDNE